MRLPDFFVIGAAKAGTNSLHASLRRHPDIFMSELKEPEFFARDDLYPDKIEAYAAHFAAAGPKQVVGEASTIYSMVPLFADTAARIRQHVPQARFVYVLRQPVDRAYSYFVQLTKNYQNRTGDYVIRRTFEDFVLPERHAVAAPREQAFGRFDAHLPDVPELCLAGSDYVAQIEAYLEHFDRTQMLFLKFESFRQDPETALRQITDFLGVVPLEPEALQGGATERNVSSAHFRKVHEAQRIRDISERAGPLWKLREAVPAPLRQRLRRLMLRGETDDAARAWMPPPMEAETRCLLEARFAGQIDRLTELTGMTFEDWHLPPD